MSCEQPAISAVRLSKAYRIYNRPQDRLLQIFYRGRRCLYTNFWALKDVSFEVDRGTTLGVIGRNASGKSTLLHLVAGTLYPTDGQVTTRGRVSALLELGTGFNPEFSGRENALLNAVVFGLSPSEIEERFEDIVAFADIGDFLDRPVKTYSGGMVVRLAFAVAISVDPDILIIDEALAVGDMGFQRKCYRRINELREKGVTCLFVTHDTGVIRSLCDQAMLLEKGSILEMGDTKRVADSYVRLLLGGDGGPAAAELEISSVPSMMDGSEDTPSAVFGEPRFAAIPAELRFDVSESQDPPIQGHMRAYVAKSVLLDETGDVAHNMYVGRVYRIRSLICFREEVDHFLYGVLIRDRLGQDIFGDSVPSPTLQIGEDFKPGDSAVIDAVFRADTRQDTYFITLGIANLAKTDQFFYAMDVLQMRLEPLEFKVFGVTNLQHRFEGRRLAGAPSSAVTGEV